MLETPQLFSIKKKKYEALNEPDCGRVFQLEKEARMTLPKELQNLINKNTAVKARITKKIFFRPTLLRVLIVIINEQIFDLLLFDFPPGREFMLLN